MFTESPRLKARTFLVQIHPQMRSIFLLYLYIMRGIIVELLIGRATFIKPRFTADRVDPSSFLISVVDFNT